MDSAVPPDMTRDNVLVGSIEDRGPNEFALYTFHADFANGVFALSDPTIINVDSFTDLCNLGACVASWVRASSWLLFRGYSCIAVVSAGTMELSPWFSTTP